MKGRHVTDAIAGSDCSAKVRGRLTDEWEDGTPDADRASELRAALVVKLRADQKITSPAVEAAFRAVARERFLPAEVPLEVAYGVDDSVVTKRDQHGVAVSSVSAAYIQARMLEQAELRPGMAVLEVGSGGLNAALIAEIIGSEGRVLSVDIDPEVTDRAAALLNETGYGGRVRVLVADAEHGVPGEGPFHAIIVTVGAWDIAPSWLDHLATDGVLVLPLIMNGVTRTMSLSQPRSRRWTGVDSGSVGTWLQVSESDQLLATKRPPSTVLVSM